LNARGVECEKVSYLNDNNYSTDHLLTWDLLKRIRNREFSLIMNINDSRPSKEGGNFFIRRAAADFAIPLLTNMQLLAMFAESMKINAITPMVGLNTQTLFDFYSMEKPSEAWTAPTEFH
jgi:carbamoyl-phosphate synthase (ammonia)